MNRTSVTSSNIRSIVYDPQSATLEVEFTSGDIYQYFNVPEHLYRGLMKASSHGQFLNDYIRNSYRYQKVNYDLRELKDMGVIEPHGASVNVFYTLAF